jgi:hypothetical protein
MVSRAVSWNIASIKKATHLYIATTLPEAPLEIAVMISGNEGTYEPMPIAAISNKTGANTPSQRSHKVKLWQIVVFGASNKTTHPCTELMQFLYFVLKSLTERGNFQRKIVFQ